jgi:hypothetical protein
MMAIIEKSMRLPPVSLRESAGEIGSSANDGLQGQTGARSSFCGPGIRSRAWSAQVPSGIS